MKINHFIFSLKYTSSRLTKSCIALVLAIMMVLATFVSLGIISPLVASAAESQTSYSDISEYQQHAFGQIQNDIFGTSNDGTSVASPSTVASLTVQSGNGYFNWTDTSKIEATDASGNSTKVSALKYTGGNGTSFSSSGTVTIDGSSFQEYKIYTGTQFAYAIKNYQGTASSPVKITLMNDIDMGGSDKVNWSPARSTAGDSGGYVYIEGNGHTIYNFYCNQSTTSGNSGYVLAGLYGCAPSYFVVKDLGFKSYMILGGGIF